MESELFFVVHGLRRAIVDGRPLLVMDVTGGLVGVGNVSSAAVDDVCLNDCAMVFEIYFCASDPLVFEGWPGSAIKRCFGEERARALLFAFDESLFRFLYSLIGAVRAMVVHLRPGVVVEICFRWICPIIDRDGFVPLSNFVGFRIVAIRPISSVPDERPWGSVVILCRTRSKILERTIFQEVVDGSAVELAFYVGGRRRDGCGRGISFRFMSFRV